MTTYTTSPGIGSAVHIMADGAPYAMTHGVASAQRIMDAMERTEAGEVRTDMAKLRRMEALFLELARKYGQDKEINRTAYRDDLNELERTVREFGELVASMGTPGVGTTIA